ncbi:MAG: UPF0280 family protein [Candidatus Electrothrix scaldis]|nr:MAG: UPF0280 family protein [Candidatus Electrothrix sp. GW3-3]
MPAAKNKSPLSYQERTYRTIEKSGLVSTIVKIAETDLHILAPQPVEDQALLAVSEVRGVIEGYIKAHPAFLQSLEQLPMDKRAAGLIQEMLVAGAATGVGPMAAVAGIVSEQVGKRLLGQGLAEVIVENGGDLYVARTQESTIAIYAGESPLSGKLGIRLVPEQMPCGVCCSSGKIGHSLSLGQADAVAVVAPSTALADAAATRLGNEVGRKKKSIQHALEVAKGITGLAGVVIISGEHLGAWGEVELVRL